MVISQRKERAISHVEAEIASQPDCWVRAIARSRQPIDLPEKGERVAVIGCGTSWFMAQSYAWLREHAGHGQTDAFTASENGLGLRQYDRVLLISRSGYTTEILNVVESIGAGTRLSAMTADPGSPLAEIVKDAIVLDWADEQSVVQTRFATSALVTLRSSLGEDLSGLADGARLALETPIDPELRAARQITFVGRGWGIGIASEAALKLREAAQLWTECYPAMEYRHGPISIAEPGRLVWSLGTTPSGLADDVARTGAHFVESLVDPLIDLVQVQRLAAAIGADEHLDVDNPRNLTRAVTLSDH
ncbi:MAG TPA: sugar isomerase [Pseudolysinimonas sp.]